LLFYVWFENDHCDVINRLFFMVTSRIKYYLFLTLHWSIIPFDFINYVFFITGFVLVNYHCDFLNYVFLSAGFVLGNCNYDCINYVFIKKTTTIWNNNKENNKVGKNILLYRLSSLNKTLHTSVWTFHSKGIEWDANVFYWIMNLCDSLLFNGVFF
jgi:hypothetical protein